MDTEMSVNTRKQVLARLQSKYSKAGREYKQQLIDQAVQLLGYKQRKAAIRALKRQGRFVVPSETVITSGRKMGAHSFLTFARVVTRMLLPRGLRSRRGLEYWYEPARE